MKLLSIADLGDRWCYTRAGIHKLSKHTDFPLPVATVSKGRIKIFREEDIAAYERGKPWLFDGALKERRQYGYGH